MGKDRKTVIHNACRMVLRPFASMMLKCGMTWKEFSDLSKSVFVEAATEEFGIKGRPTNISRVSILTGISRKEVKRQRNLFAVAPQTKGKTTDATRVLSGWYQDPEYLDENAEPKRLLENGPAPSFEALCAAYGGDIAATTMLKELLNSQTVEQADNGLLCAKRRYYQPADHDDEYLHFGVSLTRDLIETANNDVFLGETGTPRFCGKADNEGIPISAVSEFREFVDSRGQEFLEEIDDWLTNHAASNDNQANGCVRIGVGLFGIEDRGRLETQR